MSGRLLSRAEQIGAPKFEADVLRLFLAADSVQTLAALLCATCTLTRSTGMPGQSPLPALLYLLRAVMLFRIGAVSAVIAVTLDAIAPDVRNALIGMAQVPQVRLEEAELSGCIRWQIMIWIRLPTLPIGINQIITMAFSMPLIAALLGT